MIRYRMAFHASDKGIRMTINVSSRDSAGIQESAAPAVASPVEQLLVRKRGFSPQHASEIFDVLRTSQSPAGASFGGKFKEWHAVTDAEVENVRNPVQIDEFLCMTKGGNVVANVTAHAHSFARPLRMTTVISDAQYRFLTQIASDDGRNKPVPSMKSGVGSGSV